MNNSVFISRYRPGVIFAPRPGFFILPFLFLPGVEIFKSVVMGALIALGGMIAMSLFWSNQRKREPALTLSEAGLALEGMKLVPWRDVVAISRAVDPKGRPALYVDFSRKAPSTNASPLWKISGPQSVIVHTSLLTDPLEAIEGAFEHFMQAQLNPQR